MIFFSKENLSFVLNVHKKLNLLIKSTFKIIFIYIKFTVKKLPIVESEIKELEQSQQILLASEYKKIETQGIEFVKDSEGYVSKKPESELAPNEKIISEKEYKKSQD